MLEALRTSWRLLVRTVEECQKDNTPLLAAGLAFYTLLSLAPALWLAVGIAGMVVGRASVRAEVVSYVIDTVGPKAGLLFDDLLMQLSAKTELATTFGIISTLFGATILFAALQDSLNFIWDVVPKERGYIKDFLLKRLVSFALVLGIGVLLIAFLLIDTAVSAMLRYAPELLQIPERILSLVNLAAPLVLITLLCAVIYRVVPDRAISWRDVWIGAALTAALLTVGKILIGFYLGYASLGSVYGTAGSLVVFLLWVYYSAQIFLFGAEFTEVYATDRKRREDHAPDGSQQLPLEFRDRPGAHSERS
jgi:membrane protein